MTREEKREIWRERIERYRSSGLTAAEWCEKNEVNVHTIKTMISRLGMAQRKYKSSQDNKQKTMRHLESFMLDGRLEIINNHGERAIKPFVIGRKNFLFANTPKGATSSARI